MSKKSKNGSDSFVTPGHLAQAAQAVAQNSDAVRANDPWLVFNLQQADVLFHELLRQRVDPIVAYQCCLFFTNNARVLVEAHRIAFWSEVAELMPKDGDEPF